MALVIFATDPLSAAAFSKAWPATTVYYQIVPNKLLEYVLAPATVIIALIAIGVDRGPAGPRPGLAGRRPGHRVGRGRGACCSRLPGIVAMLGLNLPVGSLFTPLCLLAAAATWFAGHGGSAGLPSRRCMRQRGRHAGAAADWDRPRDWAQPRDWDGGPDATGDFEPVGAAADDEFGIYRNGSRQRSDD